MFCANSLGENQVLEPFPVGRRLAFDPERGRLWVVCPTCERWNLTPLDQRWEALEDCEKGFRASRLRVSSENIGLARLPEGLELVRIGDPLRPEMAAWRYGDQFGRRRRRALILKVRPVEIGGAKVRPLENGWKLEVPHTGGSHILTGRAAVDALGLILPRVNRMGGNRKTVREAVRQLEEAGSPERYFHEAEYRARKEGWGYSVVQSLPAPIRLALEMGAHEEQEREAAEGELVQLEARWREAEEIAAIADDLALPDWLRASLERMKRQVGRS